MKRLKITNINPGAISAAGLRINDHLDSYNGIQLDSSEALSGAMRTYEGQTHTLSFIRGLELLSVELKAGALGISVESSKIDVNLVRLVNNMMISTTHVIPGSKVVKDTLQNLPRCLACDSLPWHPQLP